MTKACHFDMAMLNMTPASGLDYVLGDYTSNTIPCKKNVPFKTSNCKRTQLPQ